MVTGASAQPPIPQRRLRSAWIAAVVVAVGVRLWNALRGPLMRGYDDHGHLGYVLYLDLYHALPWADQGWSYFHPPLHYLFGWALAQLGSAEALVRGLALLGGAASLGIAALAARVVRMASPERPGLAWLAFVSTAFLPVFLYTSTMAGNELSAAFLGTLGLVLWLANERRERPTLRLDAAAGLVLGLALLTKVSALLVLATCGVALALRALRTRDGWRRIAARGLVLAGIAVALSAPYYARNLREFGTPFRMSRDTPHVAELESRQPPGSRSWWDFVYVPVTLLADPHPQADHLLHSVWGSAYVQMWVDARASWDILPPANQERLRHSRSAMATLGLAPTLLAFAGAFLCARDVRRRRREWLYVPLFVTTGINLAAFALFAVEVPHFSALKSSYLLGLTLPFVAFQARSVEVTRRRALRIAAVAAVVLAASASALVSTSGLVLPRLHDQLAMGALHLHFGELDAARSYFRRGFYLGMSDAERSRNLGALDLLRGEAGRARNHYARPPPTPGEAPFHWNALGVATAAAGEPERSLEILDEALAAGAGEVALTNRGVVEASLGRRAAAEADLRGALELDPRLEPARHALAEVLDASGRHEEALGYRSPGDAPSLRAPRGYPYGIPDGLGQRPSWNVDLRWMLWLDGTGLRIARAPFRDRDAITPRAWARR